MKNNDVIYFSVNNWFCGRDYPDTKNFRKWLGDDLNQNFMSDKWCKENKLCVYQGCIDMSCNYTVSAPREWVEKNCPELLTDDEYTYYVMVHKPVKKKLLGGYEYEDVKEEHKKKYSDFVYKPDVEGDTPDCDKFDMPFREYKEENFGCKYYETGYWDSDEDEEDDEDLDDDDERTDDE